MWCEPRRVARWCGREAGGGSIPDRRDIGGGGELLVLVLERRVGGRVAEQVGVQARGKCQAGGTALGHLQGCCGRPPSSGDDDARREELALFQSGPAWRRRRCGRPGSRAGISMPSSRLGALTGGKKLTRAAAITHGSAKPATSSVATAGRQRGRGWPAAGRAGAAPGRP